MFGHLQFMVGQKHNLVGYLILHRLYLVGQNVGCIFRLVGQLLILVGHCSISDRKAWSLIKIPSNFHGTSAELQPNKNIEDINNRKIRKIHQLKNKYQKTITNRTKEEQIMGWLSFYGPSNINSNRRFRMDPYG